MSGRNVANHNKSKPPIAAIALILVGLAIVGFFGLRMFRAANRFHGRRPPPPPGEVESDVSLIRDWMTVPYIGRMYHVPGKALFDALQIPPDGNFDKSLSDLNREYYPDASGYVIAKVKEAVLANMPPTAPDPATPPATIPQP